MLHFHANTRCLTKKTKKLVMNSWALLATVQPTPARLQAFEATLIKLSGKKTCPARMMASLLGTMESLAETVPLGRVLKRPLQRSLAERFKPHTHGFHRPSRCGGMCWPTLNRFLWCFLPHRFGFMWMLPLRVGVLTYRASGAWSDDEQSLHILSLIHI